MNTEAYGKLLKAGREAAHLSQSEAARRLGKVRETLSLLERGQFRNPPSPVDMQAYEALYGIPQWEQLAALGYPIEVPTHPELGVLSGSELTFLERLRALPDAERATALRLLEALL